MKVQSLACKRRGLRSNHEAEELGSIYNPPKTDSKGKLRCKLSRRHSIKKMIMSLRELSQVKEKSKITKTKVNL